MCSCRYVLVWQDLTISNFRFPKPQLHAKYHPDSLWIRDFSIKVYCKISYAPEVISFRSSPIHIQFLMGEG